MGKDKFAVWDIDGTIFKSACLEKAIEVAVDEGIFRDEDFYEARAKRKIWQNDNNEGVYQSYLNSLVGAFVAQIAGIKAQEMDKVVNQMVNNHQVRRFKFTRALLEYLNPTHNTVAISGSPEFMVKAFLADLQFDEVVGSQFEVINGTYTGNATSTNKAAAFETISKGTGELDVVVGDTIGDLEILEQATRPIAFNPSATLRRHAIERSWPIVTENKDSIYQLIGSSSGYQTIFERNPAIVLGEAL